MDNPRNFGYLLVDVSRLYLRRFAQRAAVLGVTLAQGKTLGYLKRNEGIAQARLAELCDIEPMALVRILDRMEADGWIERRADPRDRRAKCLYLRPAAHPVLAELAKIGARLREEAIGGAPARDGTVFMRVLEHLYEKLSEPDGAPACAPAARPATPRPRATAAKTAKAKPRKAAVRR